MRVRGRAEFEADFPLDWIKDEDGEDIPGLGKPTAEEIVKLLESLGCVMDGDIFVEEEHGCQFRFLLDGVDIFCQSSYVGKGEYILGFKCFNSRFGIFPPSRATWNKYGEAMMRISSALRDDGRFENLRWYAMNERRRNPAGNRDPVYDVD